MKPATLKSTLPLQAQANGQPSAASAAPAEAQLGLLARLVENITSVLRQTIPLDEPCALLDHPDHPNVGDSAIWLGERQFLRRHHVAVAYTCSVKTFDAGALRAAMPRGTVLIHGGGNFGTLWPHHQQLREQVLQELRSWTIDGYAKEPAL